MDGPSLPWVTPSGSKREMPQRGDLSEIPLTPCLYFIVPDSYQLIMNVTVFNVLKSREA